jgi:hypothetical protein
VINTFLLFKIRAFEFGHANLIFSPSKMALTLMRPRCDPSRNKASLMPMRGQQDPFSLMSLQPSDQDRP